MPGGDAQALLADTEVLVIPVAAHGRGRHEADWFVVLALDELRFAVLPRHGAERFRPCVGVTLALDADENGGRGVLMRLRVPAGLVLADPEIKAVLCHR